jgi:hypothetical protein
MVALGKCRSTTSTWGWADVVQRRLPAHDESTWPDAPWLFRVVPPAADRVAVGVKVDGDARP